MNRFNGSGLCLARLLVAVLTVAGMCQLGWAQIASSITGRVEDSSGGAIPGVEVTVKNLETGQERKIEADDTGNYRMLSLAVGRYEVRAEKTGFKTAVQTGINLSAEQQAVVNLRLEIGAVQEQVIAIISGRHLSWGCY